jgi:phosphoribosylformimino-5-aminoimidazole carboxamide ribotide isomerase
MLIIPAIDLKGGQCVRLLQGREEDVTVYSDDPVATARKWEAAGARLIHLVDLDGAFSGEQKNIESVKAIREAVDVDLELGGGIRDMAWIDMLLALGINRVILGTISVENPELVKSSCRKHPGRIIVGIDAKDGKVAVRGWVEVTEFEAVGFAKEIESYGAAGIVYTDIERDGMLTGPNVKETKKIAEAVDIPVIASGGIKSINDIRNLLDAGGIWGAITGKAIYSGSLDLEEAIRLTGDQEKH